MKQIQQVLQVSAQLFALLGNTPKVEERDQFIKMIHQKLEERQTAIDELMTVGFVFDESNKMHVTLQELDKGIQERLQNVLKMIKEDLKSVQNAKKNEQQYLNPYSNVQVMDGMYYDKKK
ncbi:MAG: flagellar protein FliT [Caryophanon sp.]|nr:flagellar protein FliT [Caryophanon sp.]